MVGSEHGPELSLGFSPTDPDGLMRALRLFIDGGKRGVAERADPPKAPPQVRPAKVQ
jgi:hypothetical protein